MPDLQVFISIF